MKKTKTPKALKTNILKTLTKEQIVIIAIVLAFLLLLTGFGIFRYIVYPNLKVQEISQSTVDLKDIDFLYSVTHNTANGASGVEVTGTYLESAQQADIYVTTMDNDKKSEGIRFLIDKDQMYVDTRNLFQATGKYWLGDMNSDEYFEKMYDEIFSSDITNIDMNTYGCRIWNGGSPWLHELLQLSSILKNEADNTILNSLHYSGGGDVFTAKVDTDKLVDGLTTFYENLKSNEDYYKDDVANIILSYGNEVKGYSGIFGQTMGVWADETSQSIKDGDAEDVQLFQDVYQFLTELITNCRKNDAIRPTEKPSNHENKEEPILAKLFGNRMKSRVEAREQVSIPTYTIQKKKRKIPIIIPAIVGVILIAFVTIYLPPVLVEEPDMMTRGSVNLTEAADPQALEWAQTYIRNNPEEDFDHDGLTNEQELNNGTGVYIPDNDFDGTTDYAELYLTETNPCYFDNSIINFVQQSDAKTGNAVNTPFKVHDVVMWADDYESKARGGVIPLADGSYNFYRFQGWVQFPSEEARYAYKVVNGVQEELKKNESGYQRYDRFYR